MTRGAPLRKIEKGSIRRKPDWRARLSEFVTSKAGIPFDYATGNDCGRFAADAVEAMTGKDPMPGLREYKTKAQAKAVLTKNGFKSHVEVLELLFEEIKPAHMLPGDIVVLKRTNGLGIFQGQYVYTPGVALVDPKQVKRAFRVPEEVE